MSVQGCLKHLRSRSGISSVTTLRASCLSRPSTIRPGQYKHHNRHHPSSATALSLLASRRTFANTATMKFTPPSEDPPKHEMAYFPNMTTSLPSESGEFRRVLWTGLYSQLVLMTVPVDGEIGDEVSVFSGSTSIHKLLTGGAVLMLSRNTPSTRS